MTYKNILSIICPLYNKAQYIEETILSVVRQNSSDWELIIVDDNSTDGSYDLAKGYTQRDKRVKVIRREDQSPNIRGANVCRNIGLKVASGDYVMFLDADDLLMPYCVEQRINIINSSGYKSLYIFNVAYFKQDDALLIKAQPSKREVYKYRKSLNERIHFLNRFLKFDLPWHTSGPVWKKQYLINVGGWCEQLQRLQDPELHIRALFDSKIDFHYLMDETIYDVLHRNDDGRLSYGKDEFFIKQLESLNQFIDNIVSLVKAKGAQSHLKSLQGYLIFAETLFYRYIRDKPDKFSEGRRALMAIYDNPNVGYIRSGTFNIFLVVYRIALRRSLIRAKLPGALLFIYKRFFL